MMLSCYCEYDYDGDGWYWDNQRLMIMPPVARRKPCRCCGALINWGEQVYEFSRARWPNHDIEERIHGDEVILPPWYTCEECSDLISAVSDLGFCWDWGTSIKDQIAEYREAEKECAEKNAAGGGPFGPYFVEDFL